MGKVSTRKINYRRSLGLGGKVMTITKQKIGFQHVGSFLRPDVLKQARKDFSDKKIDHTALTTVEDEAIRDLVTKEINAGLDYVTDG